MNELKPCPLCGGEAKLYSIGTGSPHYGHYHQVVCQGCLTSTGAYWSGEQSAIDAWNSRAERTCRIEGRNGDWYCDACGEMVGTCDPASELCIDGNAVELWNYCPNCGAKVVS